ncbi:MAG: divalent metal cation transporter [Sodalis sp. (in: enterobacteria)]|uniref:divalent metal cation transporter n=1 Tax=Sodalis sp. (in: enterobacteria) TaxID=1898979 RepID=UPI0039E2CD81
MPHNLYLHSSIVQSRQYDRSNERAVKEAIRYATIDSNIQLGFSFIINCLLLILGAALFLAKTRMISAALPSCTMPYRITAWLAPLPAPPWQRYSPLRCWLPVRMPPLRGP